jgi:hypothetical protein
MAGILMGAGITGAAFSARAQLPPDSRAFTGFVTEVTWPSYKARCRAGLVAFASIR